MFNTVAGHHYVLTTRLYSLEMFRREQTFHSAAHPAGSGVGGARFRRMCGWCWKCMRLTQRIRRRRWRLRLCLYDSVISSAPGYCTYALVNAESMQCAIAFTRLIQAADTEVRSALPGQSYNTLLVGALSDGAECNITSGPALDFFTAYVPAPNQLIQVRYRGTRSGGDASDESGEHRGAGTTAETTEFAACCGM